MSDGSAIEWTDATWNPVRGCTKVSPGCKFCYAETIAERFRGVPGHPFEQGFDLRIVGDKLDQPLSWRRPPSGMMRQMQSLIRSRPLSWFVRWRRMYRVAWPLRPGTA
jgi:protein gp37